MTGYVITNRNGTKYLTMSDKWTKNLSRARVFHCKDDAKYSRLANEHIYKVTVVVALSE